MPDAKALIQVPGEPIIVGRTVRKKEIRGPWGTFVRYPVAAIMVDGETHHVTPQNVLKGCPDCGRVASAHPNEPCVAE